MGSSSSNPPRTVGAFVGDTLAPWVSVLRDVALVGRDDMDPEVLHDFRVALRRVRSDLRTLRPLLDRQAADDLRTRLAALDSLVRPVRDGDVLIERLAGTAARVANPIDADIVESIHHHLVSETAAARVHLLEALASPMYVELGSDLERFVAQAYASRPDPAQPAVADLAERLRKRVKRMANGIDDNADDVQLHALRIQVKRTRFLLEAAIPELGKRARRTAKHLARIQDILGEHQDSVVFSVKLLALPRYTGAQALGIDALLARETEARQRLRKRWRSTWRRSSRRWR